MKRMGIGAAIFVALFAICAAVWAVNDTNVWPSAIIERKSSPSVTLPEALRIAQEYVQTNKVNVSHHYLYSVSLAVSDGKDCWYVKWLPTNPYSSPEGGNYRRATPDWFTIRVDMDKKVKHFGGQ